MKLPYGVADFQKLRREGQIYLDRTDRIPVLEGLGSSLLFLRPRRFGKSLWLSVLEAYYDLRTAEHHEEIFADLAMEEPGEKAHSYFIMRWDFSEIDPDPPRRGMTLKVDEHYERIDNELRDYLNAKLRVFQMHYREHLPEIVDLGDDPFHNMDEILAVIERTPYKLYLLIDEYDNFANEVLANDQSAYEQLVHSDGPFKYLFKWLKSLVGRGTGLDRFFITGVSPMVMSDITSGLNITENVYFDPELNTLCGFTDDEIVELLEALYEEKSAEGVPSWTVEEARGMMRDWYNGYRFAPMEALDEVTPVYNPTLVFYFLQRLQRHQRYPDQMLDSNLAADEGKLEYLAQVSTGREAMIDLIRRDKPLEVSALVDHFSLRSLLDQSAQDNEFIGAYLYYFGMLTLAGRSPRRKLLLTCPNEVVRGLYLERIKRLLLPLGTDRNAVMKPVWDLTEGKEIEPVLDFVEEKLFPIFSNRDTTWANELTVKTIFLTLLWDVASYLTFSEPELDHRYADLCMLRRPDARDSTLYDLLFEFKRLSLKELGMSGEQVRASSRDELAALPAVVAALDKAQSQLESYRTALGRRLGDTMKLRAYSVVALGFERLVVRLLPV